ncbi:hypothetical protein DID80_06285, partial [Candidatus Marinamargulisbacteria bacterium SCGC AAA071-K20]
YGSTILFFLLNLTLTHQKQQTENHALDEKFRFEKVKRHLVKEFDFIKDIKRQSISTKLSTVDQLLSLPLIFTKITTTQNNTTFEGYLKENNYTDYQSKLSVLKQQFKVSITSRKRKSLFILRGKIYDQNIKTI